MIVKLSSVRTWITLVPNLYGFFSFSESYLVGKLEMMTLQAKVIII
jgi:hypothetical protein